MMFAVAFRSLALAPFADCGTPIVEVHSAVVYRRNCNPPSAICEAVLPIPNNPNKPVVERVSSIVHDRDTPYDDLSCAAGVHPAFLWRKDGGQTERIEP